MFNLIMHCSFFSKMFSCQNTNKKIKFLDEFTNVFKRRNPEIGSNESRHPGIIKEVRDRNLQSGAVH